MKSDCNQVQGKLNQSTSQQQYSSQMIRVNRDSVIRGKQKQKEIRAFKWHHINSELLDINYDLSEGTCLFYIDREIIIQEKFIALRLFIKPLVGLFRDIELRPQIYFKIDNSIGNFQPPKIYNNFQLFHPNIDLQDCQIIVPDFVKDWNPTISYTRILQKLKYIILQPNPHCIPNNQLNKKAALFYKLHRNIYREHCENYTIHHSFNDQNKMDIQGFYGDNMMSSHDQSENKKQFIDIDYLFEPQQAIKPFDEEDYLWNGIFDKKRKIVDDRDDRNKEQEQCMTKMEIQQETTVKKMAILKF